MILISASVLFSQNSYFQGFFSSHQVSMKLIQTNGRNAETKYHLMTSRATQEELKEGRTLVDEWPSVLGIICHIKMFLRY